MRRLLALIVVLFLALIGAAGCSSLSGKGGFLSPHAERTLKERVARDPFPSAPEAGVL